MSLDQLTAALLADEEEQEDERHTIERLLVTAHHCRAFMNRSAP